MEERTNGYTDADEFAFLQGGPDGVNGVAERDADAHCEEDPED
jgi:hypothetical protein